MKKEISPILVGECRPDKDEFICTFERITSTNELEKLQISVKAIEIDGCNGVDADITPARIKLKASYLTENELKARLKRNPTEVVDYHSFKAIVMDERILLDSNVPYPCE